MEVGKEAAKTTASLAAAASALIAIDTAETSALKVLAKQIEASTEKVSATAVSAEQGMAAVAKEIADKEMIDRIVVEPYCQSMVPSPY